MAKEITYYGFQILRTSYRANKKYYVPQTHTSGIEVDESQCRQFDTIKAAKEHIRFRMFGHE